MAYVLIKSQTADDDAAVTFVHGTSDVVFDSTYKEYLFTYVDYRPSTDERQLHFQVDVSGATTYGQNATTATAYAGQAENAGWNSSGGFNPDTSQGNNTDKIKLTYSGETDHAGYSANGQLRFFDPSGGTHMKMWDNRAVLNYTNSGHTALGTYIIDYYSSGYIHQTSALTTVQFVAATSFGSTSGNISTGTFTLYGIT